LSFGFINRQYFEGGNSQNYGEEHARRMAHMLFHADLGSKTTPKFIKKLDFKPMKIQLHFFLIATTLQQPSQSKEILLFNGKDLKGGISSCRICKRDSSLSSSFQ